MKWNHAGSSEAQISVHVCHLTVFPICPGKCGCDQQCLTEKHSCSRSASAPACWQMWILSCTANLSERRVNVPVMVKTGLAKCKLAQLFLRKLKFGRHYQVCCVMIKNASQLVPQGQVAVWWEEDRSGQAHPLLLLPLAAICQTLKWEELCARRWRHQNKQPGHYLQSLAAL